MTKNIDRFLKRKAVGAIIGNGASLTNKQCERLLLVFDTYGSPKKCENWLPALAYMIKYDLSNYLGRLRRLKAMPSSPSKYSFVLRYGDHWRKHYVEASKKKTNHFQNRVIYWQDKGYTVENAQKKVTEIQSKRSAKSPAAQKGATDYSIRCIGYWVMRGYSEEEAKIKVSESQSHARSPVVIAQWLATLAAKSEEEKILINQKKGHSIDAFVLRGYELADATKLSNRYYAKRNSFSKTSQVFFMILDEMLGHEGTYYKTKNYEKQIGTWCVDFYDSISKTVIEYYGDFWHRNPKKYNADFVAYNRSSDEIWNTDNERMAKIAAHKEVNNVIIVWESEVMTNPHCVAEKIIKEIKNGI